MAEPQLQQPKSAVPIEDLTGKRVGRFAIRARLGAGGMGEVYLAEDSKLKRSVALKRLAPHLRADQSFRQRFLTEAQRASALNDVHIAQVYDVFEEKDEAFLVMEYIEGSTLRRRLEKPQTIAEFLRLASQCAQALAVAHEKGVLHCDLKPENIMLTSTGSVKVLDFGVAKRVPLPEPTPSASTAATDAGKLSGTPAYMAPEVLLMKPPDARADIFSLGVVFYETLAGRHPFLAEGFVATSDRILHEEPPPPSAVNRQVPARLDRIIFKMLAKDPAGRFASAQELLAELGALQQTAEFGALPAAPGKPPRRWTVALTLTVAAVLALAAFFALVPAARRQFRRWAGVAAVPREKELAVLPFTSVGGDGETRAFASGLAETLTARLTRLTEKHSLEVVPPGEVRAKGVTSLRQAREEFGVNLGLEGSLQKSGDMARVTYSLVDAITLRQLRGDTITARASDPFALEDRVAESVLDALEIELQPQERDAFTAQSTTRPAAYDFYLQGRGYLQDYLKPGYLENSIAEFNHALEQDPSYSLAFAGLGEAYWHEYGMNKNGEWVSRARDACNHAIALRSDLAVGHICLGLVEEGTGHYEKSAEEYGQAVRLEPSSDQALRGLASAYEQMGKAEEAEKTYRQAISLRPHYWMCYNALGAFLYGQGRYAEAAPVFGQAVTLAPNNFVGYSNLGVDYVYLGRYVEAIAALQHSVSIQLSANAYSNLATAYFYLRRYEEAARTYEQALKSNDRDYLVWGNLGDAYYWAPGRRAEAAGAYRKAISLAEQQLAVNPRDATVLGYSAYYHAMLGERRAAHSQIKRALTLARRNPELLFNAALLHNQLGETDRMLDYLERALGVGFPPTTVRNTPNFDSLRDNTRFQALMKRF